VWQSVPGPRILTDTVQISRHQYGALDLGTRTSILLLPIGKFQRAKVQVIHAPYYVVRCSKRRAQYQRVIISAIDQAPLINYPAPLSPCTQSSYVVVRSYEYHLSHQCITNLFQESLAKSLSGESAPQRSESKVLHDCTSAGFGKRFVMANLIRM
jgi:hypothetical protein